MLVSSPHAHSSSCLTSTPRLAVSKKKTPRYNTIMIPEGFLCLTVKSLILEIVIYILTNWLQSYNMI
jgi:hypothetical protein